MKLPSLFKLDLRTKYRILAVLMPHCWLRNSPCDPEWDDWLWSTIANDKIIAVGSHAVLTEDEVIVWTANYPYASGCTYLALPQASCSRATALFLHDRLPRAKIMSILRGTNTWEYLHQYGLS